MQLSEPATTGEMGLNLAGSFLMGVASYLVLTALRLILSRRVSAFVRFATILLVLVATPVDSETRAAAFAIWPILMPVFVGCVASSGFASAIRSASNAASESFLRTRSSEDRSPGFPERPCRGWRNGSSPKWSDKAICMPGGTCGASCMLPSVGCSTTGSGYWGCFLAVRGFWSVWARPQRMSYSRPPAPSPACRVRPSCLPCGPWGTKRETPGGPRRRRSDFTASDGGGIGHRGPLLVAVALSGGAPSEGREASYAGLQPYGVLLPCLLAPWFSAFGLLGFRPRSLGELAVTMVVVAMTIVLVAMLAEISFTLAVPIWSIWMQPIAAAGVFVGGWLFLLLVLWVVSFRRDLVGQRPTQDD